MVVDIMDRTKIIYQELPLKKVALYVVRLDTRILVVNEENLIQGLNMTANNLPSVEIPQQRHYF